MRSQTHTLLYCETFSKTRGRAEVATCEKPIEPGVELISIKKHGAEVTFKKSRVVVRRRRRRKKKKEEKEEGRGEKVEGRRIARFPGFTAAFELDGTRGFTPRSEGRRLAGTL